ncbi:predicted protein [Postia placenta Mad-698-R]|nr:predicted protein [Postia placenta Mad-698-R]
MAELEQCENAASWLWDENNKPISWKEQQLALEHWKSLKLSREAGSAGPAVPSAGNGRKPSKHLGPITEIEPGSYLGRAFRSPEKCLGSQSGSADGTEPSSSLPDSSSDGKPSDSSSLLSSGSSELITTFKKKKKRTRCTHAPVLKPKEPDVYDGSWDVQHFHKFMTEVTEKPYKWTLRNLFTDLFNYCSPIDFHMKMCAKFNCCKQGDWTVYDFAHELDGLAKMSGVWSDREKVDKLWASLTFPIQRELWQKELTPTASRWDDVRVAAEIEKIASSVWHLAPTDHKPAKTHKSPSVTGSLVDSCTSRRDHQGPRDRGGSLFVGGSTNARGPKSFDLPPLDLFCRIRRGQTCKLLDSVVHGQALRPKPAGPSPAKPSKAWPKPAKALPEGPALVFSKPEPGLGPGAFGRILVVTAAVPPSLTVSGTKYKVEDQSPMTNTSCCVMLKAFLQDHYIYTMVYSQYHNTHSPGLSLSQAQPKPGPRGGPGLTLRPDPAAKSLAKSRALGPSRALNNTTAGKCFICRQPGHMSRNCPDAQWPDFAAIDELHELAALTAMSDGLALHNIDLGCLGALSAMEESSYDAAGAYIILPITT